MTPDNFYLYPPSITAGLTVSEYRAQRPHRPRRHLLLPTRRRGRKAGRS